MTIRSVRCAADSDVGCNGPRKVERGGVLRIRGRGFQPGQKVVFLGGSSAADDVSVPATVVTSRRVDQKVPETARSGRLALIGLDGSRTSPSRDRVTITKPALDQPENVPGGGSPPAGDGPGTPSVVDAGVNAPKLYYAGRPVSFSYTVKDDSDRVQAAVVLTRLSDGQVIKTWQPSWVPTGQAIRVTWDGSTQGKPQLQGRYRFALTVKDRGGRTVRFARARRSGASAQAGSDVDLYGFIFPIRGAHEFGTGAGRFGGGRGHQGQDTFAKCGTPLVAARGGTVQFAGYHGRAGNYVVIDGKGTREDHAYMHLRRKPLVRKRERVQTGQQIGEVGQTGRAFGCHLHFEMWTPPGWYEGGRPYDPLPSLRAWDGWS